jgi:phosphoglycolate phosphatase-like HAD superfamily hydrolase
MDKVKLVVFDLDGTLVDTMGSFANYAATLMVRHYGLLHETGYSQYMETSGLPFRQQLEVLFPHNVKNDSVADQFEAWKVENLDDAFFRPEVEEIFDGLHNLGLQIAISSNNLQQNVDHVSQEFPSQIDIALGFRDENFHKGEPHFQWLEKHHNVDRSEMVFVGDSLNDCRIAMDCNVTFLAFPTTFSMEQFFLVDPNVEHVDPIIKIVDWIGDRQSRSQSVELPMMNASHNPWSRENSSS